MRSGQGSVVSFSSPVSSLAMGGALSMDSVFEMLSLSIIMTWLVTSMTENGSILRDKRLFNHN